MSDSTGLRARDLVRYIDFTGTRGGKWPVTLGMASVLDWHPQNPFQVGFIMAEAVPVPDGLSVDDVLAAIGTLISRHEGLRTTYARDDADGFVQIVQDHGRLGVQVCETAEEASSQRPGMPFSAIPFDHARDFPLRVRIETWDGAPRRVLLDISHLAVDAAALRLIAADLSHLLQRNRASAPAPFDHQPVDQALEEAGPQHMLKMAAARRYIEAFLEHAPACAVPTPMRLGADADYREAKLISPAAAVALNAVAKRLTVSRASLLLGCLAAICMWWTNATAISAFVPCVNRFTPKLRRYTGMLSQDAFVVVEAAGGAIDDLLVSTHRQVLAAYANGYHDNRWLRDRQASRELEKGARFHRDFIFNNMAEAGDQIFKQSLVVEPHANATQVVFSDPVSPLSPFLFDVHSYSPALVVAMSGYTELTPARVMEALLRGLENLLAAAVQPGLVIADFDSLMGIEPFVSGPRSQSGASAPADTRMIEGIVREVAKDPGAAVVATWLPSGNQCLTAYLRADSEVDLTRVHGDCVRQLGQYHGLVAPHRYVVVAGHPQDGGDLADGSRRVRLLEGSGR